MTAPTITEAHVAACRALGEGDATTAPRAAFCAGAVLIDEDWTANEHQVAQLAQEAYPRLSTLELARCALPIAEAIERHHDARKRHGYQGRILET